MATAPVKSQPLHNFSLPFLKWGQRVHLSTTHRFRTPLNATPLTHQNCSPPPSSESDTESEPDNRNHQSGTRPEKQQQGEDVLLKECEERAWNLRPRKPAPAAMIEVKAVAKPRKSKGELPRAHSGNANDEGSNRSKSLRRRGYEAAVEEAVGRQCGGSQRKEKKRSKLWISLSREEIEEDVYALTGSKPSRRPKKRSKSVQKLVDNVFPGLYLVGMSTDSYRDDSLR